MDKVFLMNHTTIVIQILSQIGLGKFINDLFDSAMAIAMLNCHRLFCHSLATSYCILLMLNICRCIIGINSFILTPMNNCMYIITDTINN